MRTAHKSRQKAPRRTISLNRPRLIAGVLIFVLLLVVAWRIFVEVNARSMARTDPEAALGWRGNSAAALTALADQRLAAAQTKDEYAAAIALAESALIANPLQERAIALIALARNASGETAGVESLMQRAATRSQRDTPVQGWLLNNALNRSDYAGALDHANAILLTGGGLQDEVLNNLKFFTSNPEARAALLARLALAPPWRTAFLVDLSTGNAPADVVFALLSDLALTSKPPTNAELAPILTRLVREGQFDLAYVMWINFLPKEQRGLVKYAFNGDFELPPSALPFDWSIPFNGGATTAIVDGTDAGHGRVLQVEFADKRAERVLATQILTLTPGHYRLTGSAKAVDIQNERGLVWSVTCAVKDGPTLVATPPLKGTVPWREFAVDFEVPPAGCRGQTLVLELPARAELEKQISGEAWFDDLAVERLRAADGNDS